MWNKQAFIYLLSSFKITLALLSKILVLLVFLSSVPSTEKAADSNK